MRKFFERNQFPSSLKVTHTIRSNHRALIIVGWIANFSDHLAVHIIVHNFCCVCTMTIGGGGGTDEEKWLSRITYKRKINNWDHSPSWKASISNNVYARSRVNPFIINLSICVNRIMAASNLVAMVFFFSYNGYLPWPKKLIGSHSTLSVVAYYGKCCVKYYCRCNSVNSAR